MPQPMTLDNSLVVKGTRVPTFSKASKLPSSEPLACASSKLASNVRLAWWRSRVMLSSETATLVQNAIAGEQLEGSVGDSALQLRRGATSRSGSVLVVQTSLTGPLLPATSSILSPPPACHPGGESGHARGDVCTLPMSSLSVRPRNWLSPWLLGGVVLMVPRLDPSGPFSGMKRARNRNECTWRY